MNVIGLVVLIFAIAEGKKLPSFVEVCHRTDPNMTACLLRNVETLRPRLAKGIPELLLPPMEPLVIPKASLDSSDRFAASFSDIEVYNVSGFRLHKLDFDLDKLSLDLDVTFPTIRIHSRYDIDGKLLVVQVKGQGFSDGNYTNVFSSISGKGAAYKKNGKDHLKIDDSKINIEIEAAHLYFDRLFGDNEELNDQTNKVINDNIKELIAELKPVIIQVVREFVLGICNRLLDRFSIDELFPNP